MNYFLKNLINKYKKNLSLNEYGKIRIKTEGKCFCSENKKHTQDLPKHILEQKGMIQLAAKYGNSAAFLIDFVLKEQKKLNEIIRKIEDLLISTLGYLLQIQLRPQKKPKAIKNKQKVAIQHILHTSTSFSQALITKKTEKKRKASNTTDAAITIKPCSPKCPLLPQLFVHKKPFPSMIIDGWQTTSMDLLSMLGCTVCD